MVKLTVWDVLLKIKQLGEVSRTELTEWVRKDARFQKISKRVIYERVRELKKERFIEEEGNKIRINENNERTWNLLAFLYWSKLKGRNYNDLLEEKTVEVFKRVMKGTGEFSDIMEETKTSKPTALKYISILEENNFLKRIKEKPLILTVQVNDHSIYYINYLGLPLEEYLKKFDLPQLPEVHSKKLMKELIRLHTYSTTVTEGNTATLEDVEGIFENRSVKLTPREVLEIVNTKKIVEKLLKMRDKAIGEKSIKRLHQVLMNKLVENPGEFYYGTKKIIGSKHHPPHSKQEIEAEIKALANFVKKYEGKISPLFLGILVHFMFVNIHPFQDGNGRIARLLHSWILLKHDLSLFAYDPNKRNQYFMLLEKARESDMGGLIKFCVKEHLRVIQRRQS